LSTVANAKASIAQRYGLALPDTFGRVANLPVQVANSYHIIVDNANLADTCSTEIQGHRATQTTSAND
jgi:hypothetical protein